MKQTVTAMKAHIYAGKRRKVGDRYEIADAQTLRLYRAIGFVGEPAVLAPHAPAAAAPAAPAAVAPAAPAPVAADTVVEDKSPELDQASAPAFVHEWANVAAVEDATPASDESEAPVEQAAEVPPPKPKRQYRRRDLKAEE